MLLPLLAILLGSAVVAGDNQAWADVTSWMAANGALVENHLHGNWTLHGGARIRGVVTDEVLDSGRVLLEVPRKLWVVLSSYPEIQDAPLGDLPECGGIAAIDLHDMRVSVALALETLKGEASFHHPFISRLPNLEDYNMFYPRHIGPKLDAEFEALPLVKLMREFRMKDQKVAKCFESWRSAPGSPIAALDKDDYVLALARFRTRAYEVGSLRTATFAGFVTRPELNGKYVERQGPQYEVGGYPTYWSALGDHFAFWCAKFNETRLARGSGHLAKNKAGECYSYASSPTSQGFLDNKSYVPWSEWGKLATGESGWIRRPTGGVAEVGTQKVTGLIPASDLLNTASSSALNTAWNAAGDTFTLKLKGYPVGKGEEVFDSYCTSCDNSRLLTNWGIYMEDNPNALKALGEVHCGDREGPVSQRSVTLKGFVEWPKLNLQYVERLGPDYEISGHSTYWSASGEYFVYWCSKYNETRVAYGVNAFVKNRQGACNAFVSSRQSKDFLDPNRATDWAEWTQKIQDWFRRSSAGVSQVGTSMSLWPVTHVALELGGGAVRGAPRCKAEVFSSDQGPMRCSLARLSWEYCAHEWQTGDDKLAAPGGSIYGHTYVQLGTVGYASYHFVSEDEAYISYEDERSKQFVLDDGTHPPARKPFHDMSFDPKARVFRGTVTWAPPSTWNGNTEWQFEMIFDSEFVSIIGGKAKIISANGEAIDKFFGSGAEALPTRARSAPAGRLPAERPPALVI